MRGRSGTGAGAVLEPERCRSRSGAGAGGEAVPVPEPEGVGAVPEQERCRYRCRSRSGAGAGAGAGRGWSGAGAGAEPVRDSARCRPFARCGAGSSPPQPRQKEPARPRCPRTGPGTAGSAAGGGGPAQAARREPSTQGRAHADPSTHGGGVPSRSSSHPSLRRLADASEIGGTLGTRQGPGAACVPGAALGISASVTPSGIMSLAAASPSIPAIYCLVFSQTSSVCQK